MLNGGDIKSEEPPKSFMTRGYYHYKCGTEIRGKKCQGRFWSDRKFDNDLVGPAKGFKFSRFPSCLICGKFNMYAVNPDWEVGESKPEGPILKLVINPEIYLEREVWQ